MNEQAQPPVITADRSEFLRFFRWLFSWRGLHGTLIVLAWIVTLGALLYAEENWRGRHAWNKYRRELEARGEQLDFNAFIPKAVPDKQNFAATPFIQSWFPRGTSWEDDFARADGKVAGPSKPKSGIASRQFIDLAAYELAFQALQSGEIDGHSSKFDSGKFDSASRAKAAPAVLELLKSCETELAELHEASRRPHTRYPVNYDLDNPWAILLPHLARVKAVCRRLQVRASAELAAGQTGKAFEDLKLLLYMADGLKEEDLLISYLVRVACLQLGAQTLWEGLAEHRWSEPQLLELQTRLQNVNFVADLRTPLGVEQAAAVLTVDLMRKRGNVDLDSHPPPVAAVLFRLLIPGGWFDLEKLNYCRLLQSQLKASFDPTNSRVIPHIVEANARELEVALSGSPPSRFFHHRLAAGLLLPALDKSVRKAAIAQTVANQAALACALERYRLANGQFPEKLDDLSPKFVASLPHDVLTGEAYKYRRNGQTSFILYSIGWDEKDDGGVAGKILYDEKSGDWVWDSAPPGSRVGSE